MSWRSRAVDADEAVSTIKSGMTVFVQGAAATPMPLLDALARRTELADLASSTSCRPA